MSEPKDRKEEKAPIKQTLHWNGYPTLLLEGADTPPLHQPVEEGVEENPPDQHLIRQGQALMQRPLQSSPLTWTKQEERPSRDSLCERSIRAGEKSDERIWVESIL